MSAFDESHPYYVTNAKQRGTKEKPRWSLVHVEFRKKLSAPVRSVSSPCPFLSRSANANTRIVQPERAPEVQAH